MEPDSYLAGVLADARRGFRYRSGVAWLLGQPDVVGPHPTPVRLPRGGFHYLRSHDVRSEDARSHDVRSDDMWVDDGWPGRTEAASSSHMWEPAAEAADWPHNPFWMPLDADRGPTDSMAGAAGEEMPGAVGPNWLTTEVNASSDSVAVARRSMTVGQGVPEDATARRPVPHRGQQSGHGGPPDRGATTQENGGPDPLRAPDACRPPDPPPHPQAPSRPSARATVPSRGSGRAAARPILAAEDGAAEPNAFTAAASTHTGTHQEHRTPIRGAAQPMPPARSNTPAAPARLGQARPVASGDGLPYVSDPVRSTQPGTPAASVPDGAPHRLAEAGRPTRAAASPRSAAGISAVDARPAQPARPNPPPPQPEILSIRPAGEDPYGDVPGFWTRRHLRARQLRVLR